MRNISILVLLMGATACTELPQIAIPEPPADGLVRGLVQNEQGWELEGLQILALSEEGRGSRIGMTDFRGMYSIEGLSKGTYVLRVSRGDEVVAEKTLRIQTSSAIDTDFIVPVQYRDRPDQRGGPIVKRHFVSQSTSH